MRIKILLVFAVSLTIASFNTSAATKARLDHADTNIMDTASLQNGAKLFMNYCSGCHAISFMRYNRIGKDLGLSDDLVKKNLMFAGKKTGETITTAMPESAAASWFGGVPPDLSLVARSKGTDWIYTYLKSFYEDESRIFGVNNKVLVNASMPDALWSLRDAQSDADFDNSVRDITNFLDYVGEPAKLIRLQLGKWVLLFLGALFILVYMLKKEYWKDVKYGIWRSRD